MKIQKENPQDLGKRKPIRHNKQILKYFGGYLFEIFGCRHATKLPGIIDYNWLQ